jgi:hypothetical protein
LTRFYLRRRCKEAQEETKRMIERRRVYEEVYPTASIFPVTKKPDVVQKKKRRV